MIEELNWIGGGSEADSRLLKKLIFQPAHTHLYRAVTDLKKEERLI